MCIEEKTLKLEPLKQFKATVLERLAPPLIGSSTSRAPIRISSRKNQLALYLKKLLTNEPLLQYQLKKQAQQLQLTKIALNFLSIPTISSEYERVFSSYFMQTIVHSSRLLKELLQKQEYLKNQQRRGFVEIILYYNTINLGRDF